MAYTLQRPHSPLRYPGGKRRLVNAIIRLLEWNGMHDIEHVETHAGGASIALALLYESLAPEVHRNDLSRPVYALWHTAPYHTEAPCARIARTDISVCSGFENGRRVENPTGEFGTPLNHGQAQSHGVHVGCIIGG